MTRDEVVKIIRFMTDAFPTFSQKFLKKSKAEQTEMIDSWYFLLDEYDYTTIAKAIKNYVKSSGSAFEPSVAQLIAMSYKPAEVDSMSDIQAWSIVRKAIGRGNYYAEEDYENMPEPIKEALGSASQIRIWAMDEDYNESVISSQFLRAYRATQQRVKDREGLGLPKWQEQKTLISTQEHLMLS